MKPTQNELDPPVWTLILSKGRAPYTEQQVHENLTFAGMMALLITPFGLAINRPLEYFVAEVYNAGAFRARWIAGGSGEEGATGDFPYGKIHPDDAGGIKIAIAGDKTTETVFIDFGKPVHSLGLRPEQAEAVAQSLLNKAQEARR